MKDEPHQLRRRCAIRSSSCSSEIAEDVLAQLGVPPEGLGNTFIFIVKNGRKRSEQMGRENSALIFGQIKCVFL
jgi:hypothetical protein